MTRAATDGVQGYSEQAEELIPLFEALSFEDAHRGIVDLIPPAPCNVLDIGAGSGRDAAWFAARGDHVIAIEPTAEMRASGMKLHPSPNIVWIDDTLPELRSVRGETFDLVWMSAVWMHFTLEERAQMTPTIAALVGAGGALMISLRHGPIPAGRRMFQVSATEAIAQAEAACLHCVRNIEMNSTVKPDVRWSRLWFQRADRT